MSEQNDNTLILLVASSCLLVVAILILYIVYRMVNRPTKAASKGSKAPKKKTSAQESRNVNEPQSGPKVQELKKECIKSVVQNQVKPTDGVIIGEPTTEPTASIIVLPSRQLVFNVPFVIDQCSALQLTNKNPFGVGFRISCDPSWRLDTTPQVGILQPNESVNIEVNYRKFAFDPATCYNDSIVIEFARSNGQTEFNTEWFEHSLETRRMVVNVKHHL